MEFGNPATVTGALVWVTLPGYLDRLARKAGLHAEYAARATLAGKAMANRNAYRIGIDGCGQLAAATGGVVSVHFVRPHCCVKVRSISACIDFADR